MGPERTSGCRNPKARESAAGLAELCPQRGSGCWLCSPCERGCWLCPPCERGCWLCPQRCMVCDRVHPGHGSGERAWDVENLRVLSGAPLFCWIVNSKKKFCGKTSNLFNSVLLSVGNMLGIPANAAILSAERNPFHQEHIHTKSHRIGHLRREGSCEARFEKGK